MQVLQTNELDQLIPIAKNFFGEADLVGGFVPEHFVATWYGLIEGGAGIIFGIKEGDKYVGVLGAIKYPDPNDGEIVCSEAFWYVNKESRGHGIGLLKQFESWAKEQGAKRITMAYLVDSMPDKVKNLYEHMGYRPKEVHYIKQI